MTANWTVAGSCTLTPGTGFANADFSASNNATASATVNCNKGFKVNASSLNGAIKTAVAAPANFTNTLPYSLKVDVTLDDASVVTATCASSTLVAGQSGCALSPNNGTGL